MPRTVTVDDILHVGDPVKVVVDEGNSKSLSSAALNTELASPESQECRISLAGKIVTMYEDLDIIALVIDPEQAEGLKLKPNQPILLEKPTEDGLWLGATSLRSMHKCRVELCWPRNCASVERREYCRVSLASPVRYALAETATCFETGILRDLSGGGARLSAQQEISAGQNLILEIPLTGETVPLTGVVRHVYTDKDGGHVLGIEFTEMLGAIQNRIISYVFNEQLRTRREKLLRG
jgi:hypothetical protein